MFSRLSFLVPSPQHCSPLAQGRSRQAALQNMPLTPETLWDRREGGKQLHADRQALLAACTHPKPTYLNAMMLPGQKSLNTTSCVPPLPLEVSWHICDCEMGMCVRMSNMCDCKPLMAAGCFWNGGASGVHCTNLASRMTSCTSPGMVRGGT